MSEKDIRKNIPGNCSKCGGNDLAINTQTGKYICKNSKCGYEGNVSEWRNKQPRL